jgi:hypothetical protein
MLSRERSSFSSMEELDAEGATAPETLRQRGPRPPHQPLERDTSVSADGIIISGNQTEGAHLGG